MSPLLFEALRTALDAARATQGLVDPTIGRTLRLAGYDATFSVVRGRDGSLGRPSFVRDPDWRTVELDETHRTVRAPKGVELDLGATAKALAADRAANRAHAATGTGVLISLGGDIAVAGPPPKGGWSVRIAEDNASPLDIAGPVVGISAGGLATSGTTTRTWVERRSSSSSHRRSSNRAARKRMLAERDCRRRIVRRCEHGEHGGDRPRRACRGAGSPSCSSLRGSCVTTGGRSCRGLAGGGGGQMIIAASNPTTLWYLTRDRRRRSSAAHGIGPLRRAELDPLAERTAAAVSRRRAPSKRDADRDRVRGHTRRHHGRRRLCAGRVRDAVDPVPVPVPADLARAWARSPSTSSSR